MTPNFALSLSFEGIRLLHRVAGGWALAGDVSLDAPDLAAEMKALHATAIGLEPDGLRTKLLLPNDQIKFIEIDTTRTTTEDIHAAIDAATPIPLDDLVIDFERTGGRTQVAAVARQTLEEAEGFAKEHGFEPMTFVAIAEPLTFSTEVFFGPTKHCRAVLGPDVEITRDDSPAVLPSIGTLPGFMTAPTPPITPPAQVELPLADPDPVDPEPVAEPDAITDEDTASDNAAPDETPIEAATDEPVFHRNRATPAPDETEIVQTAESDSDLTPVETAPPDVEITDEPSEPDVIAPAPPEIAQEDDAPEDDQAPEPVFASRSRPTLEITSARRVPDPAPAPTPVADLPDVRPAPSGNPDTSPIAFFARSGTKDTTSSAAPDTKSTAVLSTSEPDAPAVPKPLKATDATPSAPVAAPIVAREITPDATATTEPRSNPIAPLLALLKRPKPVAPTKADLALGGTKGQKAAAVVGGKPKHLGLIMTAALIAFMLIAAMWASSRMENGLAGLFQTPTVPDVAETAPVVIAAPAIVDVAAAPENDPAPVPASPVITTAPGTVLSPSEAARIYAATGVWQRAPRLPDGAQAGNLDVLVSIATLPAMTPNGQPDGPDLTVAAPDRTILAPPNPIAPNRPVQRDDRGFILAAANGTILPTGVWIYGRKPAIVPPLRPTPDVIPAAAAAPADATVIDEEGTPETDVAQTSDVTNDVNPDVVTETATPGSATPDDATPDVVTTDTAQVDPAPTDPDAPIDPVNPDPGTVVIAGRPILTPPLRPGSAPPDATREDGDLLGNDPALATFRPALRPDGLVPPPPPEPFADPTLAGLRPSLRPADLAPPPEVVEEDPVIAEETAPSANPDISSIVAAIAAAAPPSQIVNPTRNAIAASPRPDPRPRNFNRVVSAAQSLAARQQQRSAAASTSAAAAAPAAPVATAPARSSGPTTATVAQAATVSNAIRLRDMNLIGVYGRPGNRRALIRLSNGRYVKVEVGSNLDGGRVTAIGDSALNFVKRGQTYALQMPSG